ncbi:MAG: S-layer family protein [Scytonematopsis contorta HA4267-MV1]|nr:S-layer family protein [Scytonematopsis contorta HA4267-MV1]
MSVVLQAGNDINLESFGAGTAQSQAWNLALTAGRNISLKSGGINLNGGEFQALADNTISLGVGITNNINGANNAAPMRLEANNISVGSNFNSLTLGNGRAADIIIKTNTLNVLSNSAIGSNTEASGQAGNVDITSRELNIASNSGISSYTLGSGNGGLIKINTDSLRITGGGLNANTGYILETDSRRVDNTGNAGTIDIKANSIFINGGGMLSETAGLGRAGTIRVNTDTLEIRNNASIGTSTFPGRPVTGDAGLVEINARSVLFDNDQADLRSGLGSTTRGSGNGGTIILNATGDVVFRNRGGIGLNAEATGKGGTLFLTADSLLIENSGISSDNRGTGEAGNININVNRGVVLRESGISVSATNPNNQSRAAGNIKLSAFSLTLERSSISGTTQSGNGGNINLTLQDLLSLNTRSLISTTAGTARTGGNGGNIDIRTQFIIAEPNQNTDITANAFTGSGGRVDINAVNLFGIAPLSTRQLQELRPNDLDPRQLPTNDITATSQTNPSLSGQVTINSLEADPNRVLIQLPTGLVDISQQIVSACSPGNLKKSSSFISTGRSGLPLDPTESLENYSVIEEWVEASAISTVENTTSAVENTTPTENSPNQLVEARGMIVDASGNVQLVANAANNPNTNNFGANFCNLTNLK